MLAKPILSTVLFFVACASLASSSPTTDRNMVSRSNSHGTLFGHVADGAPPPPRRKDKHGGVPGVRRMLSYDFSSNKNRKTAVELTDKIPPGVSNPAGKLSSSSAAPLILPNQVKEHAQIPGGPREEESLNEILVMPNSKESTANAFMQGVSAGAKSITGGVPKPSDVTDKVGG